MNEINLPHFNKKTSCVDKVTLGERAARKQARILQQTQGIPTGEIRAYPCQYGPHWHVGHLALSIVEIENIDAIPDPQPVYKTAEETLEWAEESRQSA